MNDRDLPRIAPDGYVWVCCACGKTAEDRYGHEGKHHPLWDESCMLNAKLFRHDLLEWAADRVKRVREEKS